METKELSMIEQLGQLRITAKSEIAPHEFLFEWNGVPCFAKGELVAVTGKAKSGKTYLNSLLMAAAGRDSGLTSGAQDKETAGLTPGAQNKEGGFNRAYIGADGKIDKARLFESVLANKSLAWNDLRLQLMQKAGIRSPHFAETLIQEARDGGMLQTILINGRREYLLGSHQQLFDEVT